LVGGGGGISGIAGRGLEKEQGAKKTRFDSYFLETRVVKKKRWKKKNVNEKKYNPRKFQIFLGWFHNYIAKKSVELRLKQNNQKGEVGGRG